MNNLVSGVIAGLVATGCVVVFRAFWENILVPWFEERVYKDAKIEGTWYSVWPTDTHERQEVISLARRGHAVTGEVVCTHGPDEAERYDVAGSFRNLILALIYETGDRSKTDRGTITLKLFGNARRLAGKVAAYDTNRDLVEAGDVLWFRSKSDVSAFLERRAQRKDQLQEFAKRERETEVARRKVTGLAGKSVRDAETVGTARERHESGKQAPKKPDGGIPDKSAPQPLEDGEEPKV